MKNKGEKKKLFILKIFVLISVILFLFMGISNIKTIDKIITEKTKDKIAVENSNGIITNIWLEGNGKLDNFKKNNIIYLFVDVGNIDDKGNLLTSDEEINNFIDFINSYEENNNYDFILLPYTEAIIGIYDFNSEFQNNLIKSYSHLTDLGFDGAHIDIEAIPLDKRGDYVKFIDNLRLKIGNNKKIAVYPGLISENPNEWEWNITLYKQVYDRVEIITLGGYDTGIDNNIEYSEYMKNQINTINSNFTGKFIFIAPTHKNYPETLENSLEIFNSTSNKLDDSFIGTGIFSEWTTDNNEWKEFEKYS